MSMYECKNCGEEHSTIAQVFMAINTTDEVFPYYNTAFEQKFNELWTPTGVEHYDPEGWKKFWQWLGDNVIEWFCCKECAIEYLVNHREKEEKLDEPT